MSIDRNTHVSSLLIHTTTFTTRMTLLTRHGDAIRECFPDDYVALLSNGAGLVLSGFGTYRAAFQRWELVFGEISTMSPFPSIIHKPSRTEEDDSDPLWTKYAPDAKTVNREDDSSLPCTVSDVRLRHTYVYVWCEFKRARDGALAKTQMDR